ncbi:alpha/beta hydrolase [Brackiella oedipodis]|uniref:alpha/beta hydrolase n=1 Tax=Brackiella oedipodis TaxID=124225 RepID=UPI0006884170|nr:alpha/beta hydrolase [Brackiella oedipodis]
MTYTIETGNIKTDKFTFSARFCGDKDKPLIIFLHGWPEFANWWDNELPVAADKGYFAVAFDQRGYALEAQPDDIESYQIEKLAQDVIDVADQLGAQKFHVVGHDWGGLVSWQVAADFPDRVISISSLTTPHPVSLREAYNNDPDQHKRFEYVRNFQNVEETDQYLQKNQGERVKAAFENSIPEELIQFNADRMQQGHTYRTSVHWYRASMDQKSDSFTFETPIVKVPALYIWASEDVAVGEVSAKNCEKYVDAPYQFEKVKATHWLPNNGVDVQTTIFEHIAKYK